MRDDIFDAGQVLGATTTIAGAIYGLVDASENLAIATILSLVIAAAAGVIASTVTKRTIIRK